MSFVVCKYFSLLRVYTCEYAYTQGVKKFGVGGPNAHANSTFIT